VSLLSPTLNRAHGRASLLPVPRDFMTDAFVIETATAVTRFAVRHRRVRDANSAFLSASPRSAPLEQRLFSSTEAARRAAESLERAQRRRSAR
jgi:hypothetical protein